MSRMPKQKYYMISLILLLIFSFSLILYFIIPFFGDGVSVFARSVSRQAVLTGNDTPSAMLSFGMPVNINSADAETLASLPGIGEKLAAEIERYRSENGPFLSEEDLMNVPGIGEKRLESVREYICIG